MRTEDLKSLPESVDRAQRDKALALCGFTDLNVIVELSFTPTGVEAEVLATDDKGRTLLDDDGEIATHEIFIPFTG